MPGNKFKKIAVYGGAFNPPHLGHAAVIEILLKSFPGDEIWLMVSGDRLDKKIGVSGKERLEMLEIMVKELFPEPGIRIKISTLELDRPQLTATYDTLAELGKTYPDDEFYFVIGSDVIKDIKTKWVNGEKLYSQANFIVMARPGADIPKPIQENFIILKEDAVSADISSTQVRSLIVEGNSGWPYIARGVAEYISKKNLYKKV